ncbi:MAG: hypothetical protein AAY43_12470 [Methanosarcina sp. 795]|nr:MAG: hypothetical protein AAY43_12470 [Methanosarcina sp. 795]
MEKIFDHKLFRKKFDHKPFQKRLERKPQATAWSSGATLGDKPAQRFRHNNCVQSSGRSNRNIKKNSNSRGIVFRYKKENILKCIILKYVPFKGALIEPGCISPPFQTLWLAEQSKIY